MSDGKQPKMSSMFGGQGMRGLFDIPMAEVGDCGNADIVVFGAPSATPYESVGAYCARAPDAIRAAFGWPGILEHHDFDLGGKIFLDNTSAVDWGNLAYSDSDFDNNRNVIRNSVKKVLDTGAVPVVIGGDDSIPIPVIQAYGDHGPITVFQLDAHIDWRDEVAGERFGLSSNMRRASEMDWVDNIIRVGARGLGSARPQDYEDALGWGVKFFPMIEIQNSDFDRILAAVPKDSSVFITLDIDAMDPAIVPSVIGPAPGGLNYWQVVNLLTGIANRANVVGFELTELMPAHDIGGQGALVAARVLAIMIGLLSRQRGFEKPVRIAIIFDKPE